MTAVTGALAIAFQPFRRPLDFRGRSRRTELAGFYVLISLIQLVLDLIVGFGRTNALLTLVFWLLILLPSAALFVRRLHDSGRSGWWLAPLIPLPVVNLLNQLERVRDPYFVPSLPTPALLFAIAYLLAVIALLLWDDEPGPNRYGPNPRDEKAAAEPASPAA